MSSLKALKSVQNFRLKEIFALPKHLKRHGPLPPIEGASEDIRLPNPFVPFKNPNTGKWNPPKYSLRRQKELVKKAKECNSLHLLPPGPKCVPPPRKTATEEEGQVRVLEEIWESSIDWHSHFKPKEVAGARLGIRLYAGKKRMFKGHKWERLRKKKAAHRRALLKSMPQRIFMYKNVSLACSLSWLFADCRVFDDISITNLGDQILSDIVVVVKSYLSRWNLYHIHNHSSWSVGRSSYTHHPRCRPNISTLGINSM
jgi:large subunit ribosomal protein L25